MHPSPDTTRSNDINETPPTGIIPQKGMDFGGGENRNGGPKTPTEDRKTIVILDPQRHVSSGTGWVSGFELLTAGLADFNYEQTAILTNAITAIADHIEQKIAALIVIGDENTLISDQIKEIVENAVKANITAILLSTNTPQDDQWIRTRNAYKPPKFPETDKITVIRAHKGIPSAAIIDLLEQAL